MIRSRLYIPRYTWHVQIFYAVTCYYIKEIIDALDSILCPEEFLQKAYDNLNSCQIDTGLTYSNKRLNQSVMVIGLTSSPEEFLNSLEHEIRHLVDHIADTYHLKSGSEDVAYLTGNINLMIFPEIQMFLCGCPECHQKINKKLIR